jgi:hypothetical protein
MQNPDSHIDYELLLRLRSGDEKAFALVFECYHKYLYAMASRYLMSEEFAEDAVQYTFMKLWEGRRTFDYHKGIKNLLFTILKNYTLNEIRHNNLAIQKNYEIAQSFRKMESDFLKDLEKADFRKHFYNLICNLPPQKRKVCMLKIETEMSNSEVAEEMNISVNTVKSHYSQVIKMLRAEIDKLMVFIPFIVNFLIK